MLLLGTTDTLHDGAKMIPPGAPTIAGPRRSANRLEIAAKVTTMTGPGVKTMPASSTE